jgi:hypothetical protein
MDGGGGGVDVESRKEGRKSVEGWRLSLFELLLYCTDCAVPVPYA